MHNGLVVLSSFVPYWNLGLALGLTYVSHGLYQDRAEGSIPTLSLSDLPWHCKIPQVKPCSRCRSPSTEWHLAEQKCTGLLRLHRHYPAKHFMLNVASAARPKQGTPIHHSPWCCPPAPFSCCGTATSPTRSSGEISKLSTGGSSAFPVSSPVAISLSIAALRYSSSYAARGFTVSLRNDPKQRAFVQSLSSTRRCQARQGIQCWRDPGGLWLICKLPVDPVESLCHDHRLVWMLSSLLCSSFFKTAEAPQCCPAVPSSPVVRRSTMLRLPLSWGYLDTSSCTPSLSAGLEIADIAPDRTPVIEAKKLRSI